MRYWKCIRTRDEYSFKVGKIYVTDHEGACFKDEANFYYSESYIDDMMYADFEEVTKEDWMEQEYKAYYEEEKMKNKRYWKCIESNNDNDFTVGRVYVSDENKQNTLDNEDWLWEDCEIDGLHSFKFAEVDKDGNELCPNQEVNKSEESNYEMVNHPSHYNSNSKGIEVIDAMDAFTEGLVGIDAIDIGTAIKYIGRLGKKDNPVQEVKKAIWYLQHYVDRKEKENGNN